MEYTLEKLRYKKVGGFAFDETTRKVFDNTAEERNARLEEFYQGGGYRVFFSGYSHIMLDQAANDEFWRRKTHERMTDPTKAEILAPTKPPHPFAGKRPSLEQDYYEMMDKPNVTLVDVKSNRVTYFVSNGIVVADGTVHEAEVHRPGDGLGCCHRRIQGYRYHRAWRTYAPGTMERRDTCVSGHGRFGIPNFSILTGRFRLRRMTMVRLLSSRRRIGLCL